MQCYLKLNSIVIIVALYLFWYGDIYVTALSSDTNDIGSEDPLSIPLISDKGAPLVAMLDTNTINRKLKVYIKTVMRNMIRNSVHEEMQTFFKTSLKEDSTIDFIRNITLEEINDILKEHGQEKLFHPVRNEEKSKLQFPNDCTTIKNQNPEATSGVHTIYPEDEKAERVYCDMDTDGGGWTDEIKLTILILDKIYNLSDMDAVRDFRLQLKTDGVLDMISKFALLHTTCGILINHIIQRRIDGWFQFQRPWIDYENGFGLVDEEYWLGNKHIHSLTSSGKYELRIDLTDLSNRKKYAVYKTFVVGDAASKYKLTVGDYSGTAGDSMAIQNGMKFSTIDQDNDLDGGADCAKTYGAWWHNHCGASCLNRRFISNLCWRSLSRNSAKTSLMMLRKLQ